MSWIWSLISGRCTGCGICADVCAYQAIDMTRDMALPEPVADACTGCGSCVTECPFDAVDVRQSQRGESIGRQWDLS